MSTSNYDDKELGSEEVNKKEVERRVGGYRSSKIQTQVLLEQHKTVLHALHPLFSTLQKALSTPKSPCYNFPPI